MPQIKFEVKMSHPTNGWSFAQTFNCDIACLSFYVNLVRAGVGGVLETLTNEELQELIHTDVQMTYRDISRTYERDVSDLNIDTYLCLMLERAHRMIEEVDLPIEAFDAD